MNLEGKIKNSKLPFVFINMAITADGKIATANRAVHSFTSPRDLKHLYELRASADAIMCGARTIEISEAVLGNGGEKFRRQRLKHRLAEYPLRIIVSGSGSINPRAKIFQEKFSPIIILTSERAPTKRLKKLQSLATEVKVFGKTEVNLRSALSWLQKDWNVKRLLCEGGGDLNDALFRASLVDEIHLTLCPKIFGGRLAPTIAEGLGFSKLASAQNFELTSMKLKNGELFTRFFRGRSIAVD